MSGGIAPFILSFGSKSLKYVLFWTGCFTAGKTEETEWAPELVWCSWKREVLLTPASRHPTRSGRSLRRLQTYNKLIYFNSHIHNPTLRTTLTSPPPSSSPPTCFNVISFLQVLVQVRQWIGRFGNGVFLFLAWSEKGNDAARWRGRE